MTGVKQIPGFMSETANIDGVRLHYWLSRDPDATLVLLWHWLLGTGYAWHKVMPALGGHRARRACARHARLRRLRQARRRGGLRHPGACRGVPRARTPDLLRSWAADHASGVRHGRPTGAAWAADHPDEIAELLYVQAPGFVS